MPEPADFTEPATIPADLAPAEAEACRDALIAALEQAAAAGASLSLHLDGETPMPIPLQLAVSVVKTAAARGIPVAPDAALARAFAPFDDLPGMG